MVMNGSNDHSTDEERSRERTWSVASKSSLNTGLICARPFSLTRTASSEARTPSPMLLLDGGDDIAGSPTLPVKKV